jgi:hypothetical protein
MKRLLLLAVAASGLVLASPALADVKVTDQPYVRQDGGTDAVIQRCSIDNRQQNEPTIAVSPTNASLVTAGSNDYCTVPTAGDAWAGFYYSSDGGNTWTDSLLPGYPGDTSADGQASPLHGVVGAAGDPVQAWDNFGHLYYGGIAFNRGHPQNGDLWVARYSWQSGAKPQYEFTTLARRGTPALSGVFNDKIQLEVDRGANSPYSGNVYVCWARFQGNAGNNGIFFIRSTDGGRTFSKATKLSEQVHDSQFCDIAVTRTGTVFVLWRGFATSRGKQGDAILFSKSTDGGATFSKPGLVTPIEGWDVHDEYGSPTAAEEASEAACDAGETALCEGAEGKEAPGDARDCGDGPFQCLSGYVFFRANTQVRASADPRPGAAADTVYAVYDGSVPGSEIDTGTSYGTLDNEEVGTQASIYFVKTTDGGTTWSAPARIDPQPAGHQFFPDIVADSGQLHVLWQDSRADSATGPDGDFRQVPIANQWVSANPPGSVSAGPAVDTYVATSTDGGASWPTIAKVSSVTQMPQYEQFGNRDIPFFGDYNYVAASGRTVVGAWTDQRDTLPGTDPRYPIDGMDGFDVNQCRTFSNGVWSADTCPDAGGLDQNIYGFSS